MWPETLGPSRLSYWRAGKGIPLIEDRLGTTEPAGSAVECETVTRFPHTTVRDWPDGACGHPSEGYPTHTRTVNRS